MLEALKKVIAHQQARHKSAGEEFRALALSLADGKDPKPELVEQVLSDSGRSLENLADAVRVTVDRRGWAEVVATGPNLREENLKNTQKRETLIRKFEQARENHIKEVKRLIDRETELNEKLQDVEDAKRQLRDTAEQDPDRERRWQELGNQRQTLNAKREWIRDIRGQEFKQLQSDLKDIDKQIAALDDEALVTV